MGFCSTICKLGCELANVASHGNQILSHVCHEICVTWASRLIEAASKKERNNLNSRANRTCERESATNPERDSMTSLGYANAETADD